MKLTNIDARPRLDWRLPKPPLCPNGDQPIKPGHLDNQNFRPITEHKVVPYVLWVGDGWVWGWDCLYCGPDDFWQIGYDGMDDVVGESIDWPFGDHSRVSYNDWKDAGFEVR